MTQETIRPGRWRHFKGNEYQVLGLARHSETLEDRGLEVQRLCPVRKDWNDDLRAKVERKENLP